MRSSREKSVLPKADYFFAALLIRERIRPPNRSPGPGRERPEVPATMRPGNRGSPHNKGGGPVLCTGLPNHVPYPSYGAESQRKIDSGGPVLCTGLPNHVQCPSCGAESQRKIDSGGPVLCTGLSNHVHCPSCGAESQRNIQREMTLCTVSGGGFSRFFLG